MCTLKGYPNIVKEFINSLNNVLSEMLFLIKLVRLRFKKLRKEFFIGFLNINFNVKVEKIINNFFP